MESKRKRVLWIVFGAVLVTLSLWAVTHVPFYQLYVTLTRSPSFTSRASTIPSTPDGAAKPGIQGAPGRIPRIVHQTWKTHEVPERFKEFYASWDACFPNVTHKLWTDEENRALIAEKYPEFLEDYDNYKYPIQRVDAARLFIIYEYGGMYTDLDIGCVKSASWEDLWNHQGVVSETTPLGITNAFLMFEPKHPFIWAAIQGLKGSSRRPTIVSPYFNVMLSTGPTWLSYQLYKFQETEKGPEAFPHVIDLHKWRNGLVKQFHGDTWHSWDANLIKWFIKMFSGYFLWANLILISLALVMFLWWRRNNPRKPLLFRSHSPIKLKNQNR